MVERAKLHCSRSTARALAAIDHAAAACRPLLGAPLPAAAASGARAADGCHSTFTARGSSRSSSRSAALLAGQESAGHCRPRRWRRWRHCGGGAGPCLGARVGPLCCGRQRQPWRGHAAQPRGVVCPTQGGAAHRCAAREASCRARDRCAPALSEGSPTHRLSSEQPVRPPTAPPRHRATMPGGHSPAARGRLLSPASQLLGPT